MLSNILPKGSISLAAMDLSKFVNGWTITFMVLFGLAALGYAMYKFVSKSPISGIIYLVAGVLFLAVAGWMLSFTANNAAKAKQAGDNLSGEINFSVVQPGQILDAVPIAHSPIHV